MKVLQFVLLISFFLISLATNAQKDKINCTYAWDMTEYLSINKDSFKLYLYTTYPLLYGLNSGDTILAEGKVQYESDNFIKLTSKDYEWETNKSMTIIEAIDSCLNDSIRFNIIFPFNGKYKIILYLGNEYKSKYEIEERKEFIIPAQQDSMLTFSFTILNHTPVEFPYCVYLRAIKFSSLQYTAKNNHSNSFDIFIPNLTNSYFNRFQIRGEYIRVSKEKDMLFWDNKKYWKLGGFK